MVSFERFELANGLRVLLHPDPDTPLVAVNLLFPAGSKYDPVGKSGMAHLFEHLMFSGTKAVPDYDEPIQLIGGENNAFTNSDFADYYSYAPYQNLETLLWIEADRLANLKIGKQAFKTQLKVVIEEMSESCFNVPFGDVWHFLLPVIYQKHPYRWPTIGLNEQEIRNITYDDIRDFFLQYYNISGCILSVAGHFDPGIVKNQIQQFFGPIPPGINRKKTFEFSPEEYNPEKMIHYADVPVQAFYMAFPMPGRSHRDYYVMDLLSDLLALGRSSVFYEKLIKETQVLSSGDAYITSSLDTGLFIIEGKLSEGRNYEEAEDLVLRILDNLLATPVDESTMEKLRNGLESSTIFAETSTLNKAMNLAYYELIGDPDLINTEPETYRGITSADLQRVISEYLDKTKMTCLLYLPQDRK